MGFDYELEYTLGEKQTPHSDSLSRIDFDEDEPDNDKICIQINSYFTQNDLVTKANQNKT